MFVALGLPFPRVHFCLGGGGEERRGQQASSLSSNHKLWNFHILQVPTTEEEWKKIADAFASNWNFNNCIGAMDGKHIVIRPPPNSGSYYFNYKHTFSIVLLAIVDADYKFVYVDIGCNGRISDGGVFRNCNMYQMLEQKKLNVPEPTPLPGSTIMCPYTLVADDAFPLKMYILKPYGQVGLTREKRIFNYRLRRVVENAFGILANRFPRRWKQSLWPVLLYTISYGHGQMSTCHPDQLIEKTGRIVPLNQGTGIRDHNQRD